MECISAAFLKYNTVSCVVGENYDAGNEGCGKLLMVLTYETLMYYSESFFFFFKCD